MSTDPNIVYKVKRTTQHDCPTPHKAAGFTCLSAFSLDYGPGTRWVCPECSTTWKLRQYSHPEDNLVTWETTYPRLRDAFKRRKLKKTQK